MLDGEGFEDLGGHQIEHRVGVDALVGHGPAVDGFHALQHAAGLVSCAAGFEARAVCVLARKYRTLSDRAVFFSTQKNLQPQALAALGNKDKAQLGEHGRLIEKDKVASVEAAKDARFTTVIIAKGLGDDIGVHAMSEAAQMRIVSKVQALLGKAGKVQKVRPSLLQRSGKSIFFAIATLVLTGLFYSIVSSMGHASIEATGKHAGKEKLLYSVASTLGPTGTLVVGGLLTALFLFSAYKNSKKSWVTERYSF